MTTMDGERKPVTILFTDIVGSTALAERLDPEEWKAVVSGAHRHVIAVVCRYEGTIAQLLGDGVLAFFGAPLTHEDDPIRAVRTAVDIQQAIKEYGRSLAGVVENFEMRIGVNTGTVVVGPVGSAEHLEYLAIGDSVNLAARLQSAAEPGTVLISEHTARLLHGAFELEAVGELALKGKAQPISAYRVLKAKLQPPSGRGIENLVSPLVGREKELAVLEGCLFRLAEGQGQIVAILGEAGIGKSRLMEEVRGSRRERSTETAHRSIRWLEGRTLSYGQTLPFWTITQLLKQELALSDGDPELKMRLALQRRVRELFGDAGREVLPYLAQLLSVKLEGEEATPVKAQSGETLKRQVLLAVTEYVSRLAHEKPTVLVFEDLHWADPSTLEALERLMRLPRRLPLVLLLLFRTETDRATWQLRDRVAREYAGSYTEIELVPLSPPASDELVDNLLSAIELPERVRELLWEHAEGNPLYLEEIVRSLIEQGGIVRGADGRWQAQPGIADLPIPDTLEGVLLARMDRLEEGVRHTMQVASVIGRNFLYRLLEAISEAERELDWHLAQLERADLVREKARQPELEYLFKHALTQEAAYNSLLVEKRKEFHHRVGESLEHLFADRLEEVYGFLAHHFDAAGDRTKAVVYLLKAADQAKAFYANEEAIKYYSRARELYEAAPSSCSVPIAVLLYEGLGDVQELIGQHEEAREAYNRALELTPVEDRVLQARLRRKGGRTYMPQREHESALDAYAAAESVLGPRGGSLDPGWLNEWLELNLDRGWAYYMAARVPEMVDLAADMRSDVEANGTPLQKVVFSRNLVLMAFRRDRYLVSDETLAEARKASEASHVSGDKVEIALSDFVLAFCHLWRWELNEAEAGLQAVLKLAQQIGDVEREVLSLTYLTVTYRKMGKIDRVKEYVPKALEASTRAGMSFYVDKARANGAWVALREGDTQHIIDLSTSTFESCSRVNVPNPLKWTFLFPLIAVLCRLGQDEEAIKHARTLLQPPEMRMPAELEQALQAAVSAWEKNQKESAQECLLQALKLARPKGYV